MSRSFLIAALVFAAPAASAAERNYAITDFEEIRIVGPHVVDVAKGRATAVKAKGSTAALDALSIESSGRVLTIKSITSAYGGSQRIAADVARVSVTVPQIRVVRLTGSGSANVAELRGAMTSASLNGSGTMRIARIESDRAIVRLSGSGSLSVGGKVRNLDVDARGAGSIGGDGLSAADLKLNSASSGRVALSATRSAAIVATGSGEIVVAGAPACSVQNSGSGTVSCGRDYTRPNADSSTLSPGGSESPPITPSDTSGGASASSR